MKFCKKCHRRVITTEKFGGHRNFIHECDKFCQCHINVVGNDDGPRIIIQFKKGSGGGYGSKRIMK